MSEVTLWPPVHCRRGIRELVAPDAAWRFGEEGLRHFGGRRGETFSRSHRRLRRGESERRGGHREHESGGDSSDGDLDVGMVGTRGGGSQERLTVTGPMWKGGGTGRPVTRGEMVEAFERVEQSLRQRLRVTRNSNTSTS